MLSYESAEIENGFFTEELLAALKTRTADADGEVTTDELRACVSAAVRRRTNGYQHPVVDRDKICQRFAFPVASR